MNGNYSTTVKTERLSNREQLEQQWKSIDWKKAEQEVNRLQARIVKTLSVVYVHKHCQQNYIECRSKEC